MSRLIPNTAGVLVVGLFALLSAASTGGEGGGGGSQCGALAADLGAEGDACDDRDQCNQVCCVCDSSDAVFVAQGCDLDLGQCLGGDALCSAALEEDPTLCEPLGDAGASGP